MKKILLAFLLFLTITILRFSSAQAQVISVDKTAGTTSSPFTLSGSAIPTDSTLYIRVYSPASVDIKTSSAVWSSAAFLPQGNGTFSQTVGPFNNEGTYAIYLFKGGNDNPITSALQIQVEGKTNLQCGNTCSPYSSNCPTDCPCINYGTNMWICASAEPSLIPPATPVIADVDCIKTAIGVCINIKGDVNNFVAQILKFGVGIAGGIAFLLMLFATFLIMTSAGNPDKLKAGKELLTSAITGLLLIIFSVYLLQLIGVTILNLPFFTKP